MKKPNDAFHTNKLFNVKGKVPLVTGGGTDIELMPAQALAADGAKVYICGRIEEKLDKIAEIYGKDVAGEIISVVVDMSKKDDIKKLVSESLRRSQETVAKTVGEMLKNPFEDKNEKFEM